MKPNPLSAIKFSVKPTFTTTLLFYLVILGKLMFVIFPDTRLDHLLLVTSCDYCVSQYMDNASFPHCCTSWQMSCEKRDERMGE